jgi:hypothetical protein
MTTSELLHQLRLRLTTVQRRIVEASAIDIDDSDWFFQQGRLSELRSQQLFLAGLIEQMGVMKNAGIESDYTGDTAGNPQ